MNFSKMLFASCLLIVGFMQARVANFAMLYDAEFSWTGLAKSKNVATPLGVRVLFGSQATPILLNGSLARLVIQLFAVKQGGDYRITAAEQKEYGALRAMTCGQVGHRITQLLANANENQPRDLLAKALFYTRRRHDCYHDPDFGRTGWAQLFRMIEHVQPQDWRLFLMPNSEQKMVLFVPRAYVARMRVECGHCSDAQAIGLRIDDASVLKPFGSGRDDLLNLLREVNPQNEKIAQHVALSVHSLFTKDRSLDFSVFVKGHGSFEERGQSQVGLRALAQKPSRIAGLPAPEFLKLLMLFYDSSVKIFMWHTCFGGGRNANAAVQMMRLTEMLRKQMAIQQHRPYQERPFIAISSAQDDSLARLAGNADFVSFFDNLRTIIQGGVEHATNASVSAAVRAILTERPVILLPVRSSTSTWQLAGQESFDTHDLVIDDAMVADGRGVLEVPAAMSRVLVYSSDVDRPIHMSAVDGDQKIVSRVLAGEKIKLKSVIYDGPVDKLFNILFPDKKLVLFVDDKNKPRSADVQAASSQFLIEELRFRGSDQAVALGFPAPAGDGYTTVRNVWFLQYSRLLAQRGWLFFTHQNDAGRVQLYNFEIFPPEIGAVENERVTGIYRREVRDITQNVALQLKRAQESARADVLLQEAAAKGEVDVVSAFIKLYQSHGVARSSLRAVGSGQSLQYKQKIESDPDQILARRFEEMEMNSTAPDTWGIDAAYFDAALVDKGALSLGLLARYVTPQIRQKAVIFAQPGRGFRSMETGRIALLQVLGGFDQGAIDNAFDQALRENNFDTMGALVCLVSSDKLNDGVFAKIIDKTPSRYAIECLLNSGRISQQAINVAFKKIALLAKKVPQYASILSWWQQRGGIDLQTLTAVASAAPTNVSEVLFDDPQFTTQRAQQVLNAIIRAPHEDSGVLQKLFVSGKLSVEAINQGLIQAVSGDQLQELIIRRLFERQEIVADTIVQALIKLPQAHAANDQQRLRIARLLLSGNNLTPSARALVAKKWAGMKQGVTPAMRAALKITETKKQPVVVPLAKQLAAVNKKIKSFTVQLKKNQAELQKVGKQLGNAKRDLSKNQQTVKKAKTANKKKVQGVIKKFDAHIKQLQKKQKNLAAAIKKYTADLNKAKAQAKKLQAQIKKQQASEKKRKAAQKKLEAERLKKKKLAQVAAQKKRQAALKKAQAAQKKKAAAKKVQKKPAKKGPTKNARKAGR